MEGGSGSSSDDSLDVKSDKFDPLKALYSKKLRLPVTNAKLYDNVSRYEAVTSGLSSRIIVGESKKENAELVSGYNNRRFLPHQEPVQGGRGKSRSKKSQQDVETGDRNVLTRMKNTLGPLEMLVRCMDQRTRVKVYTRGARSIRGYILAYVAAFDKHWNLALEDCLEVWTRKVKRKAPALGIPNVDDDEDEHPVNLQLEKILVKETDGKIETVERYVTQMMVRGEQIAIIVKID